MAAVSDLASHAGYLLRMVSNAISHEFARKMASEGVTVAEWAVLRSLYGSDAVVPIALARRMGMTRGAISKLADRLVGKGLIERTGNPDVERGQLLTLSRSGKEKVPVLARLADDNDAAFLAALDLDQQEQLRAMLHTLIDRHGLSGTPIA